MEDQSDRDARRSNSHPFFIIHETNKPGPISQLDETDTFPYLGLTLDPRLTLAPAQKATNRSFWYAHGQTTMLDMHVHGLHPKHQVLLWIWTATDTLLPFMHDPAHIQHWDKQIDQSLAAIFCPK